MAQNNGAKATANGQEPCLIVFKDSYSNEPTIAGLVAFLSSGLNPVGNFTQFF